MKIETLQIKALHPYERNAKKHPKKQVDLLAKNIMEFGFTTPVLIDEDNNVIAGHGRLLALQSLGEVKAPCVRMSGLTEEQIKALRLADNKIAEMGEWDMGMAILELKDIGAELVDLTGFDKDLLIGPDEKDDEVPENPPPVAQIGDLWALGPHRVLCGDSTDSAAVSRLMDGKKADMVFTDPPYGVDYVSRVDEESHKNWGGIKNDDLKGVALQEFLAKAIDTIGWKNNAYIFCNWQSYPDFVAAYGMPKQVIVWDKGWVGLGKGYRNRHEFLLFYGVLNTTTESNLWEIKRDKQYEHPTQKPVALAERAIKNSLLPERIVYDAFLG